MPRHSIENLGWPTRRYRIDRCKPPAGSKPFDPRDQAVAEDSLRADRLFKESINGDSSLVHWSEAEGLGRDLTAGFLHRLWRPTMASARSMRAYRIKVVGAIWRLAELPDWGPPSTFAILPQGWDVSPEQLLATDPRKLLAGFRSDLNRAGAAAADGYLIAFIHGEFEPESKVFQLHLHGLTAGGMIGVLERLRARPKYASTRPKEGEASRVHQRVRISRMPIEHYAHQLAYLLQSFWPARRIGPVGDDGIIKRSRNRQRIKEPYHSLALLWMNRWSLKDISILVHVSTINRRLQVRPKPAYTNGAV